MFDINDSDVVIAYKIATLGIKRNVRKKVNSTLKNLEKDLQKNLLESGYFNAYKRYHFLKFKYDRLCYKDEYFSFNEESLKYLGLLKISKFDNSCDRLINNRSSKSSNIKKKIKFLLDNYEECVFITLTFTDKFLDNTNSTTRRQYVKRFFNEQGLKYVANIDFGQNDSFSKREHYHAICNGRVDNSFWSCGAVNFEKIHNYGNSDKLLSKYINKFVNHTIKKGACSTRLLASQNFFEKK